VIGLYFSASWCGPCKAFTPKLAACYKALKERGAPFEIVFISSDKVGRSLFRAVWQCRGSADLTGGADG
jgi:nucleoredoxin